MARYSLDTNIVSYILRKDLRVSERFEKALRAGHEFVMCPVVYYELRRGLLKKKAPVQLDALNAMVPHLRWLDFQMEIWKRAAEGWADACAAGRQPQDADLLIAFHAHHFSATVVTNNEKDFESYPVTVENWTEVSTDQQA